MPYIYGIQIGKNKIFKMFQFNADYNISDEVLRLKEKFNITTIIETGTHHGQSTDWFSKNFNEIITVELLDNNLFYAKKNCENINNIKFNLGSSIDLLPEIVNNNKDKNVLFYLDAHPDTISKEITPLPYELESIIKMNIKPCILIHDIDLKFINFTNNLESILPYADKIYGKDNYKYYTNENNMGKPKVKVLYIIPK
jgi:hypothetical protein